MSIEQAISLAVKEAVQPLEQEVQRLRYEIERQYIQRKPYLTPKEAAAYMGVCTKTIHRWIREGKLNASRKGSRIYIPTEDL